MIRGADAVWPQLITAIIVDAGHISLRLSRGQMYLAAHICQ